MAGLLLDAVSNVVGPLVVSTGFCAAALRALSVLRRFSAAQTEWLTAAGFAGGLVFGVLVLILDLVLG
jgi:hypothetical protein